MNYLNGGYVMIKHNATQKDLAAAYKSNRPVLVYDENQKAHWAQINETVTTETVDDEVVTTYTYSYELINAIESLVDSVGNPRFIEGDLEVQTVTGVTANYYKWSLSGTHLMIVLACTLSNSAVISNGTDLAIINLPSFINDKILPVYADNKTINIIRASALASDLTTQVIGLGLRKDTNLTIRVYEGLTLTKERNFRVQFDLLIDNDYSE